MILTTRAAKGRKFRKTSKQAAHPVNDKQTVAISRMDTSRRVKISRFVSLTSEGNMRSAKYRSNRLAQLLAVLIITTTTCQLFRSALAGQSNERLLGASLDEDADFSPTRAPRRLGLQPMNSQQASSSSNDQERSKLEAADRTAKFARVNELDIFLDDLNHRELTQAVAGQPLTTGHPFQPRPVAPSRPRETIISSKAGDSPSAGVGSQQLQTSQSQDTLIYSECALILQRTYVKNVDNPK